MKIEIQLDKDTFSVSVVDSDKVLETDHVSYDRDLDAKLLKSLDKMIKQYKIDIPLTTCTLNATLEEHSTSLKIARALIRGLGFLA